LVAEPLVRKEGLENAGKSSTKVKEVKASISTIMTPVILATFLIGITISI
jgi:hypothetical protein